MIEIGIGTMEEGQSSMKYHWNNLNDSKKKITKQVILYEYGKNILKILILFLV